MNDLQTMEAKAALAAAADLIEETGWTQHTMARDSEGMSVMPFEPTATCFCAVAAIWRSTPMDGTSLREKGARKQARQILEKQIGGTIAQWNDAEGRTSQQIIETLRAASL